MGQQPSRPAPPPPPPPPPQAPPPPPPPEAPKATSSTGFCERVMFTNEDANKVNTIDEFANNQNKLQTIQIQKVTERAYSSSTKLNLTPSIPFKFTFNGVETTVRRMTLYHPCPVRIENRQYDAVLSLNDPSDAGVPYIMLIPLEAVSVGGGASGRFFGKIAAYIPSVLRQNTEGLFDSVDVPTGTGWDLSSLMETAVVGNQNVVKSGFFAWRGEPAYERYTVRDDAFEKRFGWRQSSAQSPFYVMLENPAKIGSFDMQTIRMLPVTPPQEAIHPVPSKFFYKPGPPAKGTPAHAAWLAKCKGKKERFTMGEDSCDPFNNLPTSEQLLDPDQLITIILAVISSLAIFIGGYFALKYATGPMGTIVKQFGEKIGRAIGNVKKQMQKKPVELPGPSLPEAVTEVVTEPAKTPKGPSLPEALQGVIEEDTRKPGEDFAFKNPMARQGKTQRNIPDAKTRTARQLPKDQEAQVERKKIERSTTPLRARNATARQLPKDQEAAAGTGLLTDAQLKTDPELRKFVKPFRRRTITADGGRRY